MVKNVVAYGRKGQDNIPYQFFAPEASIFFQGKMLLSPFNLKAQNPQLSAQRDGFTQIPKTRLTHAFSLLCLDVHDLKYNFLSRWFHFFYEKL